MGDILDIVSTLVDLFFDLTCAPLLSDAMYRRGFFTALIGGFIIGKLGSKLLYYRSLVQAYFQPSALPASRPGPSGADRTRGCISGMGMLFVFGVLFLMCMASLVVAFMH